MAKTSTHTTTKVNGTKRKREDHLPTKGNDAAHSKKKRSSTKIAEQETPISDDDNTTTTPQSKNKTSKPFKTQTTTVPNTSLQVSTLQPQSLSQTFTTTIQKHNPSLTPIELEDLSLPPPSFLDTSTFPQPRDPSTLPTYLTTFTPGGNTTLTATPSTSSTPHTLILTTSAIRTTHLLRPLRPLGTPTSKLAKLFAKHMKLSVMEKYVSTTTFGIAAGTPGRVLELMKSGVLKVDGLERVVVDGSYRDEKGRGVWEDRETFGRVLELVNLEGFKMRLVRGDMKVLVF